MDSIDTWITHPTIYQAVRARHPEWHAAEMGDAIRFRERGVHVSPSQPSIIAEILLEEIARYEDVRRILQPILTRGWLSKAVGIPSENQNER